MGVSFSENLSSLEQLLGYSFKDKSYLKKALTHKSYAHEHAETVRAYNERLEFLGDSVLELIISEFLFAMYPDFTEADLSRIKAYVVQEATLASKAAKLHLGQYLMLGKGEERTGGRNKSSLLADTFEAMLAAIYLDGGYNAARDFIMRNMKDKVMEVSTSNAVLDFKTRLQEVAQADFGGLPRYVITGEKGPEHKKVFEVQVYIKDRLIGTGTGKTKKAAAQKAAEQGLITIEVGE